MIVEQLSATDELDYRNALAFFCDNDQLFIDPFSNHVDLNCYIRKLFDCGVVVCAKENEEIIGLCCAYMNDVITKVAHIQMVLVDERYQGRGIATNLVNYVNARAVECGMLWSELTVDLSNLRAQSVYQKIGYTYSEIAHQNSKKKFMRKSLG